MKHGRTEFVIEGEHVRIIDAEGDVVLVPAVDLVDFVLATPTKGNSAMTRAWDMPIADSKRTRDPMWSGGLPYGS